MYLITFLNFLNFLTSYKDFTKTLTPNKYQIPNLFSIKTKDITYMRYVLFI